MTWKYCGVALPYFLLIDIVQMPINPPIFVQNGFSIRWIIFDHFNSRETWKWSSEDRVQTHSKDWNGRIKEQNSLSRR